MLQDGGLPTGARAGETLRHIASLHARPLDPGLLIDALGLRAHERTTVRRLSGGQKQRLALALALVGRPEVAFLDEPTAGLDPQSRHAVWDLVRRLREDGVAVVLTTHLLDEAETLADRVVVVDDGRVVAAGSPADLLTGSGDTLRFEARPRLDVSALVAALPAGVEVHEVRPGSYVVRGHAGAPVDPQVIATVTAWCAGQAVLPQGLQLGRRTLEDLFLELTGRQLR
jgi:ABC-2 type transport system ATP-binding protein